MPAVSRSAARAPAKGAAKAPPAAASPAKAPAKAAARPGKSRSIDLYVRMNEDPTKDYCFSVPADQPVAWLHKVTQTLPVLLSPCYFFHHQPERFDVSVHPGYLTAEGALLFQEKAHYAQWVKPVDNAKPLGEVVAEGQLVVPRWRPHRRRQYAVIAFLLAWLYLDLPEFVSPTPGTAPSKWFYWLAEHTLFSPGALGEPDPFFNNMWWQLLFFGLHILKVGIIYLILWNGIWHPVSLNPFKRKVKITLPKPEALTEIGWTGARRTTPNDWRGFYLEHRAQRAGGVVEAFRTGELSKPMGLDLEEGEGWNALAKTNLNDVVVGENLLNTEDKFVVSRPYLMELAKPLALSISRSATTVEDLAVIKKFREYGYLDGPQLIKDLFDSLVPTHKEHRQ